MTHRRPFWTTSLSRSTPAQLFSASLIGSPQVNVQKLAAGDESDLLHATKFLLGAVLASEGRTSVVAQLRNRLSDEQMVEIGRIADSVRINSDAQSITILPLLIPSSVNPGSSSQLMQSFGGEIAAAVASSSKALSEEKDETAQHLHSLVDSLTLEKNRLEHALKHVSQEKTLIEDERTRLHDAHQKLETMLKVPPDLSQPFLIALILVIAFLIALFQERTSTMNTLQTELAQERENYQDLAQRALLEFAKYASFPARN